MTTNPTFTLTSRRGTETFTSAFEVDRDAAAAIMESDRADDFAKDLARKSRGGYLSYKQRGWLHKKATDLVRPRPARVERPRIEGAGVGILAMFRAAAELRLERDGVQHPRLNVALGACRLRWLTKGRQPGTVGIMGPEKTEQGNWGLSYPWYGRIHEDGSVELRDNAPDDVLEAIRAFERDPALFAREYGALHNECCFCEAELTDPRSVLTGYGKDCAANYRLPYCSLSKRAAQEKVDAMREAAIADADAERDAIADELLAHAQGCIDADPQSPELTAHIHGVDALIARLAK